MDDIHTTDELATILGTSAAQIDRWRKRYDWPHVKIGRTIRFTGSQVEEILARHTVRAGGRTEPRLPGQLPGQTQLSAIRNR